MSNWYYAAQNTQKGPLNEAELKELLAAAKVPATTLVWKEGMENWTPANQVPAFFFRPPPLPAKVQPPDIVLPSQPSLVTPSEPETHPFLYDIDPLDLEKNKIFAIIAYLGVFCFVPIFLAKNSAYARFHANQGLFLFLSGLLVMIPLSMLSLFLDNLPWHLNLIPRLLVYVFVAIFLAAMIYGILNAVNGKCIRLPVIGRFTLLK